MAYRRICIWKKVKDWALTFLQFFINHQKFFFPKAFVRLTVFFLRKQKHASNTWIRTSKWTEKSWVKTLVNLHHSNQLLHLNYKYLVLLILRVSPNEVTKRLHCLTVSPMVHFASVSSYPSASQLLVF